MDGETALPISYLTLSPTLQMADAEMWGPALGTRIFEENEALYSDGESPAFIYIVKSGAVKISQSVEGLRGRMGHSEFITRIAGPGDLMGLRAVLAGGPHSENATALRRTEVELYPLNEIERVLRGPATVMRTLIMAMGQALAERDREISRQYLASVPERIAQCLLQLSDRFGKPSDEGIRIGLRLSRNELAQLSGTINESLSRHLTEMKSEGILGLRGKDIFVRDRAALVAKAGLLG